MLDIKDCIRVETRPNGKNIGGGPRNYNVYIFKCSTCSNEVKSKKCNFNKHSGRCVVCSSKDTIKVAQLSNRKRPYEALYNLFLSRIKKDLEPTDLTYEDFVQFTKIKECDYCERPLKWEEHSVTGGFNLDRKNNNLSHIKNNLTVCCGTCNHTKRDEFSYEEFKKLGPILKEIRLKRQA